MKFTTIIPTLCQIERREAILRAVESIHRASVSPVKILLVVNGQRFDPRLLASMRLRKDIEIIQISEGSLIKAHLVGRQAVVTEYFSFLDDDDEYLPGALDIRLSVLEKNPRADLVVTNGYSFAAGSDRILYANLAKVESNPLMELLSENWLHNCNHLFRTASVTEKFFENAHAYMEWTWLAFRLALSKMSVSTIDIPTFRYHDTPGSLSKSSRFLRSRVDLLHRMLATTPGRQVERIVRQRLTAAWHDISVHELGQGNRMEAARAHFNSLRSHWTGLKYLSYTRRLR